MFHVLDAVAFHQGLQSKSLITKTLGEYNDMKPIKYACTLAICLAAGHAQATTIADWTFETSKPTAAGPYAPEVGSGSASGYHVSSFTQYGGGSSSGNGSAYAFSSDRWAVGDYWQFQVSTVGLDNIQLAWDQQSSYFHFPGPKNFTLAYSMDGANFTAISAYAVASAQLQLGFSSSTYYSSAYSLAFDLGSLLALDNQASVYFRLLDNSTSSYTGRNVGASGTDSVDNFTVTGSAIAASAPEPAITALLALGIVGIGVFSRRRAQVVGA